MSVCVCVHVCVHVCVCVFRDIQGFRPRRVMRGAYDGAHVLTFPLMCWYLGRQGSSANGSWENTESSPEEQELRVSGKLGEYCSVGAHRSKYSCPPKKMGANDEIRS